MEELQKKHRQAQKELQARITQKKKNATKKTRKGVNDECAELERQLGERQLAELQALNGTPPGQENDQEVSNDGKTDESRAAEREQTATPPSLHESVASLTVSATSKDSEAVKKPSRQKARLARRAAEQEAAAEKAQQEAADLPDLAERERIRMREIFEPKGLIEHEIRSDGHCLYSAIADQLNCAGMDLTPPTLTVRDSASDPKAGYKATREVAASYIEQHEDDFAAFLEEPIGSYVRTIRETGEWGGHLEIQALAKAYEIDINILQADGRTETMASGLKTRNPGLWLAYYRHSFGLGEHYNSLRKRST